MILPLVKNGFYRYGQADAVETFRWCSRLFAWDSNQKRERGRFIPSLSCLQGR